MSAERTDDNEVRLSQNEAPRGGSGIILDENGYILTNWHVVENSNKITVRLIDNTSYRADVVGADSLTDLALIKIDPVKEGFGPFDKNILDDSMKDKIHFLPRNLAEALDALEVDNDFLRRGNIFSDELLEQWVKIKEEEIKSIVTMPHPFEYKMYFAL